MIYADQMEQLQDQIDAIRNVRTSLRAAISWAEDTLPRSQVWAMARSYGAAGLQMRKLERGCAMTDWITEHDGSRWLSEEAAKEVIGALKDTLNMLRAAHMSLGISGDRNKRVIKHRALLARIDATQTPAPGVVRDETQI
jgi:hypothetical protein